MSKKPTINAMSSVDHDYCDGCGQLTVVTDVWIFDDGAELAS